MRKDSHSPNSVDSELHMDKISAGRLLKLLRTDQNIAQDHYPTVSRPKDNPQTLEG